MPATVTTRPSTFDRVDRVKRAVGERVLDGDDRLWILGQPLEVTVDGQAWTVPRGFVTDGASIPSLATVVTRWHPWDPPQRWAAICHDYLYCVPCPGRAWADRVFADVLAAEGASRFRAWAMWAAVRVGGWPAWRANQRTGPTVRP